MDLNTQTGNSISVSDTIFATDYNESLIHQVVTAYMAGGRSGSKAQKTRSEVSGGGIKPWRQKGTGRARAGTSRSPIWRKGGVTFAAKPKNWSQKVNKKMYRGAIRSILSELVRQDRLVVVDDFKVDSLKTKDLLTKLKGMSLDDCLIVTKDLDNQLELASRNLHRVGVCADTDINPVSLVAYEKMLVTTDALKSIEARLG